MISPYTGNKRRHLGEGESLMRRLFGRIRDEGGLTVRSVSHVMKNQTVSLIVISVDYYGFIIASNCEQILFSG